ncbi:hypothetical protein H9Q69_001975 [Fusarium xylarioides]|nr:hypothetical protein H9Q69_001975 [Fusarium xylarioides]
MPRKAGNGCITCRIRRVKCDLAKPSCQRCLTSKRQCDGYLPEDSTVTRRQLAEAARQIVTDESDTIRCVSYINSAVDCIVYTVTVLDERITPAGAFRTSSMARYTRSGGAASTA